MLNLDHVKRATIGDSNSGGDISLTAKTAGDSMVITTLR